MMSNAQIDFGTSGLRGHADGFTPHAVSAYVGAFLDTACQSAADKTVWIACDLRASSPEIVRLVSASIAAKGWTPRFGGTVPTPAIAYHALGLGLPAIMVTGSHIPADYNGLKFYRPDGELLKSDEAPMRAAASSAEATEIDLTSQPLPVVDPIVSNRYGERYISAFGPQALKGLRIGVFEHSAVGREPLVAILAALGAEVKRLGHSDTFVAVDTEAVAPDHLAMMREAQAEYGLHAIVSTDGDGDRPLVLDEKGNQINGDVLGALTAKALGIKTIVTPLTSTSGIELSGWFNAVVRTRIGSPYVVQAMAEISDGSVAGFEANGGFLLGSEVALEGGSLTPLATRDAVLPILAVLAQSAKESAPLSALAALLPKRVMKADRLKNIANAKGLAFVEAMANQPDLRARFDARLAEPLAIDTQDGTRLALGDGTIVHFRQSGNAPELRCYVETQSVDETDAILALMVGKLEQEFWGDGQ